MLTFLVETLGCKLNQLESEAITDAFLKCGIRNVECVIEEGEKRAEDKERKPSVIVINTCTVTSKADQKARRVIRKALRDYPDARVIVTGCYAQLNKDDILKCGDGSQRLFVINKDKIIDYINDELGMTSDESDIKNSTLIIPDLFHFNPKQFSKHTRAFLKIQDGCDKHCTYCKIRLARGKSVSLSAQEVLSRLLMLEENHAEAVLAGVNICQYSDQRKVNAEQRESDITDLLDYLLSGTDKISIRLSSLAPESIDEKLIKILNHPRIRPHFHLSVQSCCDKILERMGRVYNSKTVIKAVELLRGAKQDPFLACDIITGFPGETEIEFNETYETLKKLDFAWIHVFPYSKRKGTAAYNFFGAVHESDVTKRVNLLTELALHGRTEYVKRWIGKEVEVITEKRDQRTGCYGLSENYLRIQIQCNGEISTAGTVLKCKLIKEGDGKDFDAVGRALI